MPTSSSSSCGSGGNKARYKDETIPLEFDCIGQETTGPGGFAKALRTVPVVLELAELTAEVGAPGAWFVDFTNPTGLVTQALLDQGHHALGLCNVAIGFQRSFASYFGVTPDRVQLEHVGLNHLTWERKILVDGVDRLPELLALPADAPDHPYDEIEWIPLEFVRELGAIPSYYLHYYYRTGAVLAEQREGKTRAEEVMEIEAGLLELYKDPTLDTKPELLERARRRVLLRRGRGVDRVAARGHRRRPGGQRAQRRRDREPRRRRRGRGVVHGRSRRRPSAPGRCARARDARARRARQGLRASDDRRRDVGITEPSAARAAGQPARARTSIPPNRCSTRCSR